MVGPGRESLRKRSLSRSLCQRSALRGLLLGSLGAMVSCLGGTLRGRPPSGPRDSRRLQGRPMRCLLSCCAVGDFVEVIDSGVGKHCWRDDSADYGAIVVKVAEARRGGEDRTYGESQDKRS